MAEAAPTEVEDTVSSDLTPQARRFRGPYAVAALFVVPYLILMMVWALSNPPGAAPDEADHLVKALGVARLHIGEPFREALPANARLVTRRNASISRVVEVPARLAPDGYKCTAFHPTQSAACLPKNTPTSTANVARATPVGSYPPVMYLPIGLLARAMTTPTRAFLAGRLVCVAMATILIFLGAAQLIRWLSKRALLGAFVALTPMALFSSAMIGTSGVEISGAFAVAAIGVVAIRRKESLRAASTMWTLAASGGALILSRQLGSVTFCAIIVLIVLRIGWRPVWQLIRSHTPAFVSSIAVLVGSLVFIIWWERAYDHPALTGPVFSGPALKHFEQSGYGYVREGVGVFGWLDTAMPRWVILAWILLAVVLVGTAILLGKAADRWSLIGWLIGLVLVAYVAYATVFYPIRAGLQGRHMLPFFMLCPLLAGVTFVESLADKAPDAVRRMFLITAAVMPTIQFVCIYMNARRYAVGSNGPFFFLGSSAWSPKFGWSPWLILGFVGALALGFVIVKFSSVETKTERRMQSVEG